MIKNIVFDFGGVLVKYDFIAFFASTLGSREKAEWFIKNVFTEEVNSEMDRGVHEPRYYIEQQQRLWPDYKEALEHFDKHYTDIFTQEIDGMRQLMLDLKTRGYRLLGLSNWSSRVYDVMKKFSIFEILEDFLLSQDVHQLKPDADIYRSFLRKFDVRAEECVFIDDKAENIAGAHAVGMYGITFRDTDRLKRELEPLLQPYTFEPAKPEDESAIWQIVHQSAVHMSEQGRRQWDINYPPRTAVACDIERQQGYVLKSAGKILGYTAISFDGEPAYERLQGQWLTNHPYAVIHRTAIDPGHRRQGLARLLFIEAERLCRQRGVGSIRIDTNYDNIEMLGLIESMGYQRCGLCHYDRNGRQTERIAFEKVLCL